MRRIIIASILLLAACSTPEAPADFTEISFRDKPTINLNVGEIRVIEEYKAPIEPPYVEHRFPTPPAVALKNWAGQRLKPAGNANIMEFIIVDASVQESELPLKGGVSGFFTNQQSEKYDARMRVLFKVYVGGRGLPQTQGDVTITRTRSVAEDATVQEREELFDSMARDMMAQFDREAVRRLHNEFAAYLR